MWQASHVRHGVLKRLFLFFEKCQALRDALTRIEALNSGGDDSCDPRRRQLPGRRQNPLLAFIKFANHAWPDVRTPVIQLLLKLVLDHCTFFLDNQHFVQALRKLPDPFPFQRPAHANFVQAQADRGRQVIVDT